MQVRGESYAAAVFIHDTGSWRLRLWQTFAILSCSTCLWSGKPMSRTIVGTILAFALAIAPVFYCTQSWAELPVKAIAEAASKAVEKMKVKTWWENHHEEVRAKPRRKPGSFC
jgi:hypothetical protein